MASVKERVQLDGMIRGAGGEAQCIVSATRVTLPGVPAPPAYTQFVVEHVSVDLPEGRYEITVNGIVSAVRLESGHWLAAG